MSRTSVTGTRWFSLSGRELLVLVAGVAVVLAAVGAARCIEWIWGGAEIAVVESADVLPPPARLDVNTASDFELAMLPGIGKKMAQAIVEYRREHGPFASLEDLTRVRGIGRRKVEAIRPHAMCAPPAPSEGAAGS
ncbi:MAG: ComEA family DNA-binding protein [Planctomycetota bacterium]|jgi:competence protein ComEA